MRKVGEASAPLPNLVLGLCTLPHLKAVCILVLIQGHSLLQTAWRGFDRTPPGYAPVILKLLIESSPLA